MTFAFCSFAAKASRLVETLKSSNVNYTTMSPTQNEYIFWEILENDLQIRIPNYIKNGFTMCKYSNAFTFKSIDSDDIDYVENFIKSELDLCLNFTSNVQINDCFGVTISETNKIHFYGEYSSNPKQFRFSVVDKKIIELLVAHVNQIVDCGGTNKQLHHFQRSEANVVQIGKFFGDLDIPSINAENEAQNATKTHFFLNKLMLAANRNSIREKSGYRYDSDVKQFATYFRMLAGPFAYDTLQRNLECALPAISSTNRYIRKMKCNMVESVLRSDELRVYLEERNLPLEVCLSEDATRIDGRVQYDPKTNQMVGFVSPFDSQTGMPVPFSHKARNDTEILQHFAYGEIAHFVNVVMARPLGRAPAFCLLVFGTNSKYNAEDVSKRWVYITDQLHKSNITVISISSDSDPKYNSAMRKNSRLGIPLAMPNLGSNNWFSCGNAEPPFHVQDTPHIGTKLRNFFLKTKWNSTKLPFGKKYFIDIEHLQYLRRNFSKSEHMLWASTLNPVDKQNFKSVETICSKKVTDLLRKHVINSEGTAKFLEMMRDVIAAFWDPDLTPLERIEKIWYSLFIIRIWRQHTLSTKGLTLKNNFLTQYTYVCIELNAHSLVTLIVYLKEKNMSQLFMPKLFSSQPCESFFRMIRSFTSTFSTVANCTVKEILDRMNKLQLQSDIPVHNGENYNYPRANNVNDSVIKIEMPTRKEIYDQIEKCKSKAIQYATKIGLTINDLSVTCQVSPYVPKAKAPNLNTSDINCDCLYEKFKVPMILKSGSFTNYEQKFQGNSVSETSPFVEIEASKVITKKRVILKKSFLCWLLRKNNPKLSSDRLLRVRSKVKKHPKIHCEYARQLKHSVKSNRKLN